MTFPGSLLEATNSAFASLPSKLLNSHALENI